MTEGRIYEEMKKVIKFRLMNTNDDVIQTEN